MQDVLNELNQEVGFKGSMVMTPDGIMVASALGDELEEELVAAILSSLILTVKKTLSQIKAPDGASSCILTASEGKILLYDMANSYLVVLADTSLELETNIIAIRSAVFRIMNRRMA